MNASSFDIDYTNDRWASVDPLGEALHFLRMSGVFYARSEFTAPWGLALPALPDCLMFHVVTAGQCWLEVDGVEERRLHPGDFVLVPHGEGHRLSSAPGVPTARLFDLPCEQVSERYEILRHGGGGEAAHLICGVVRFEHPAAQRLVRLLPKTIAIEAWDAPQMDGLQSMLRLMAAEARALRPGGEAVITRLADVLVIQALRAWIAEAPAAQTGWLAALQDEQIGRTLVLIQRDPGRSWSVASLADEAAMSRSAFAARFKALVGQSPMRYVTQWRMHVAAAWLEEEAGMSVGEVADRLDYASEAAFSRAFKRVLGVSPSTIQRNGDAANR